MNEALQILFAKYTNGELSEEEFTAFELRLTEDLEFKSEFEIFKSMNGFIDKKYVHGNALKELRSFHEIEQKTAQTAKSNLGKYWLLMIPILAIIGFYISKKLKTKPNTNQVYASAYYEPNWPTTRSDNNTLAEAIVNFQSTNKQIGLDSLYNSKNISEFDKSYWLAELYLNDNQPDSCLYYLKYINDALLQDRIKYLEVLSYFKLKQYDKVNTLANELPTEYSKFYKDRIEIILSAIR